VSITNYTQLQAEIAAWYKRNDLTAEIPNFIALTENQALRDLKLRVSETTVTGTTTSATIAVPAGVGRIERLEIVSGGTKYTLNYTSPNGLEVLSSSIGLPTRYTIENGSIRLIRAPDSAYVYTLFYMPDFTPLSSLVATNWVLTNAPDVYLFGALSQASLYALDDAGFARYNPMFQKAMDSVNRNDEGVRLPVYGGLQIKPRNAR
jgi:hypothetical protein